MSMKLLTFISLGGILSFSSQIFASDNFDSFDSLEELSSKIQQTQQEKGEELKSPLNKDTKISAIKAYEHWQNLLTTLGKEFQEKSSIQLLSTYFEEQVAKEKDDITHSDNSIY